MNILKKIKSINIKLKIIIFFIFKFGPERPFRKLENFFLQEKENFHILD